VPKHQLKEDQHVACVSCGCNGCASGDLSSGVAKKSKLLTEDNDLDAEEAPLSQPDTPAG
jgi:hypothetical protein